MSNPVISSLAWWRAHRFRYNTGLVVAGVLSFVVYAAVCEMLLPRVFEPSEIETSPFTIVFQVVSYLFMIGVANVLYFLGPLSEWIVRPANPDRYRRICFGLGYWFSVALPFSIPVLLAVLALFYPSYWKH